MLKRSLKLWFKRKKKIDGDIQNEHVSKDDIFAQVASDRIKFSESHAGEVALNRSVKGSSLVEQLQHLEESANETQKSKLHRSFVASIRASMAAAESEGGCSKDVIGEKWLNNNLVPAKMNTASSRITNRTRLRLRSAPNRSPLKDRKEVDQQRRHEKSKGVGRNDSDEDTRRSLSLPRLPRPDHSDDIGADVSKLSLSDLSSRPTSPRLRPPALVDARGMSEPRDAASSHQEKLENTVIPPPPRSRNRVVSPPPPPPQPPPTPRTKVIEPARKKVSRYCDTGRVPIKGIKPPRQLTWKPTAEVKEIEHHKNIPAPIHESLWYTNDEWYEMESRNLRESNEEQRACEYGYARLVNGYVEYIETGEEDHEDSQEVLEAAETNNALLQYKDKEDIRDEMHLSTD